MSGGWEQVRRVSGDVVMTALPPDGGRPASARAEVRGAGYDLVPANGFAMLIAWLAGPDRLVRSADSQEHRVAVTVVQGATTSSFTEPRTSADQETVDEGIEEYLADAGVPGPPRGYRWYQRLPEGLDRLDDVYARVNVDLRAADPGITLTHPSDIAPALATIVRQLYPS